MREVAPHPAVISMGKPRFVKAPIVAKNAAIIVVAIGIVAWITYQLIIGVIDAILGALGQ